MKYEGPYGAAVSFLGVSGAAGMFASTLAIEHKERTDSEYQRALEMVSQAKSNPNTTLRELEALEKNANGEYLNIDYGFWDEVITTSAIALFVCFVMLAIPAFTQQKVQA